jgi:hypothetical protein
LQKMPPCWPNRPPANAPLPTVPVRLPHLTHQESFCTYRCTS